jgi:hypothetical protein
VNYFSTFIRVAPDCPAQTAVTPPSNRATKTIPQLEYALLSERPYHYTQEELQFAVHAERQGLRGAELKSRRQALWDEFFSTPHACLRASMLAKKYGWGFHFDAKGRIALVPHESDDYARLSQGGTGLTVLAALRSQRAK